MVSAICNWYAARHDNYTSPIVKGMRRSNPKERARDRILNDDELRAVWQAASENGTFGAFVRVLLLTGAAAGEGCRDALGRMSRSTACGLSPPRPARRATPGELPLPEMALDIIKAQPRFESIPMSSPVVAALTIPATARARPRSTLRSSIPGWRLHDLRRTARSLMARAGVRPDIAERVLGHAIQGVEGVYDRHSYREEKAHALKALAGLIENILRPESAKVRQLRA